MHHPLPLHVPCLSVARSSTWQVRSGETDDTKLEFTLQRAVVAAGANGARRPRSPHRGGSQFKTPPPPSHPPLGLAAAAAVAAFNGAIGRGRASPASAFGHEPAAGEADN